MESNLLQVILENKTGCDWPVRFFIRDSRGNDVEYDIFSTEEPINSTELIINLIKITEED